MTYVKNNCLTKALSSNTTPYKTENQKKQTFLTSAF